MSDCLYIWGGDPSFCVKHQKYQSQHVSAAPLPPEEPPPAIAPAFYGTPEGYFPVPPRPSEPSAAIHEAMKALWRLHLGWEPQEQTTQTILRDLVRAAKEEALLAVARAGCRYCDANRSAGYFCAEPEREPTEDGAWMHDAHDVGDGVFCSRPEVWDALAALREGR